MPEELEAEPSSSLNFAHYLGVVRRRHLHFLIPLFIAWSLVWGASWVLPPRYQSSTLILVEQPTMPKDYVTPNVNDDLQDRLQSITQQILSRTRLLHIIDQFNLYASAHGDSLPDDKVNRMRKDIDIDLSRDTRTNQISSFTVSYTSRDPHLAQQVTSELTNLFINENLEVREQQSEGTTQFLENQLETARKSLAEQEDRIREFKGQHVGEMPGQLSSNLQILSGLQSQMQNDQDALNAAKQQHVYLQTLADQYRALQASAKASDGSVAPVGLPALDQELEKEKAQLADLRSHYTDRHPDVRKLKDQIAETEKMRDQLVAGLNQKSDAGANGVAAASPGIDPAQAGVSLQIQGQLRSNQLEITNREHDLANLKSKIDDYQARLNQEPIREQQLADLTRGYDQSKANYDDLLKKKNESQMATSMELLQQGERFRVVDAPSFPEKPVFPNRLKFCGMGLGAGIAIGILVVGVLEMFDRRAYDEQELKSLIPVAILAEVPEVTSPADERRARWRLWIGWATAGLVAGAILAGSAFSYLRG